MSPSWENGLQSLRFLTATPLINLFRKVWLKRLDAKMGKQASTQASELASFTTTLAALKGQTLRLVVEANEKHHLFQAVKVTDIAALLASSGHAVPVASITIAEPIKALGTYEIALTHGGAKGSVTVEIVSN
jgi:ribosomal protein L9